MFDRELALDTLSQIKDTLSMIMARTSHIHTVDDFYMNESVCGVLPVVQDLKECTRRQQPH